MILRILAYDYAIKQHDFRIVSPTVLRINFAYEERLVFLGRYFPDVVQGSLTVHIEVNKGLFILPGSLVHSESPGLAETHPAHRGR
jgi:hypothetical protein